MNSPTTASFSKDERSPFFPIAEFLTVHRLRFAILLCDYVLRAYVRRGEDGNSDDNDNDHSLELVRAFVDLVVVGAGTDEPNLPSSADATLSFLVSAAAWDVVESLAIARSWVESSMHSGSSSTDGDDSRGLAAEIVDRSSTATVSPLAGLDHKKLHELLCGEEVARSGERGGPSMEMALAAELLRYAEQERSEPLRSSENDRMRDFSSSVKLARVFQAVSIFFEKHAVEVMLLLARCLPTGTISRSYAVAQLPSRTAGTAPRESDVAHPVGLGRLAAKKHASSAALCERGTQTIRTSREEEELLEKYISASAQLEMRTFAPPKGTQEPVDVASARGSIAYEMDASLTSSHASRCIPTSLATYSSVVLSSQMDTISRLEAELQASRDLCQKKDAFIMSLRQENARMREAYGIAPSAATPGAVILNPSNHEGRETEAPQPCSLAWPIADRQKQIRRATRHLHTQLRNLLEREEAVARKAVRHSEEKKRFQLLMGLMRSSGVLFS